MKKSFVEQPKTEKPMTPLASLKKPATKNAQMNPLLNRTQLQVYTSNKVRETVQQLEDIKDKEIRTEPKIKAKFDTFVNNFCSRKINLNFFDFYLNF